MSRKLLSAMLFAFVTLAFGSSLQALTGEQAEELYRQGQDALNSGRYDSALDSFGKLITESPDQSDRALYWQAYTLHKLGRKQEALVTLRRVVQEHSESPWRDDAEALRIEVEGVRGGDQLENIDDQLKLYALDALHQVEPEKAVKLLENFLDGEQSPKLQEHALFILAQTGSDRAAEILVDIAKGKRGKSLQRHAVHALGMVNEPESVTTLLELYKTSTDRETKEAVLESMVIADSEAELASLLRQEKDPELLRKGLQTLGAMGAGEELEAFAGSLSADYLPDILQGLGIAGDSQAIVNIMEGSQDEPTVLAAIQALAIVSDDDKSTVTRLDRLYSSTSSRRVKSEILSALMIQNAGETLLRLFKNEQDSELKREALQLLVMIDSPETEKLLEDLLQG